MEGIEMKKRGWIPCSPGCPGWAVFNGNEIQRCDECDRFASDEEAVAYVQAMAVVTDYGGPGNLSVDDMIDSLIEEIQESDFDRGDLTEIALRLEHYHSELVARIKRIREGEALEQRYADNPNEWHKDLVQAVAAFAREQNRANHAQVCHVLANRPVHMPSNLEEIYRTYDALFRDSKGPISREFRR